MENPSPVEEEGKQALRQLTYMRARGSSLLAVRQL
jgi:hypothetical protein